MVKSKSRDYFSWADKEVEQLLTVKVRNTLLLQLVEYWLIRTNQSVDIGI